MISELPNSFRVTTSRAPKDLAWTVHTELRARSLSSPTVETLIELFESMYFASLRTEESRPVLFHIVYVDPEKPDPKPPAQLAHDRWSCIRLNPRIPLSSANLVKIAPATDPRTSSFAVYHDQQGRLIVWGLVDQGNRYHDFVNFDSDSRPDRPGLFQASIVGIGHLEAYVGYEKIAELKHNVLVRAAVNVFQPGIIRNALQSGMDSLTRSIQIGWPEHFLAEYPQWKAPLTESWLGVLRRLLLRARNVRHGGAFLITAENNLRGLTVKHNIRYDRLRSAIQRYSVADAEHATACQTIGEEYLEEDLDEMPVMLHLDQVVAGYDLEDIRNELDAAIWFISLLTRVDGLVLLNESLEVLGFGVEITASEEPPHVSLAGDTWATEYLLRPVSYQHFGTRHRSMMRYCWNFPGSVGFVISQDGDVRVLTRNKDRLLLWENIQLELPEFVKRKGRRRLSQTRSRRLPRNTGGPPTE